MPWLPQTGQRRAAVPKADIPAGLAQQGGLVLEHCLIGTAMTNWANCIFFLWSFNLRPTGKVRVQGQRWEDEEGAWVDTEADRGAGLSGERVGVVEPSSTLSFPHWVLGSGFCPTQAAAFPDRLSERALL